MPKYSKQEQAESIETLKHMLSVNQTIYLTVMHVSRSGMQREIKVMVPRPGTDDAIWGTIANITFHVARSLGYPVGKHDGVVMGGCGMDMGWALVHELSVTLGFKLQKEWI